MNDERRRRFFKTENPPCQQRLGQSARERRAKTRRKIRRSREEKRLDETES